MSDLVGKKLGPYSVIDRIGAGGMATIYKGYHEDMDRYVAIKVLSPQLAGDENLRKRFIREVRTIARLEHRHILPVYDVGTLDGLSYMVMRYVDSGTMADLIAANNLPLERAAKLVAQVAEALDYAHKHKIIHRDIKPANILIGRDGDALLSDFGIAKVLAENEQSMQLTDAGMMIGTPYYMAPEIAQGGTVDSRADIYALGVVLYEALTGRRPFVAETPLTVAIMHIQQPMPAARRFNPAIPEQIENIIMRATAKSPDNRFQSAGEMAEALYAALRGETPAPRVFQAPPGPHDATQYMPPAPTPSQGGYRGGSPQTAPTRQPDQAAPGNTPPPGGGSSWPPQEQPWQTPPPGASSWPQGQTPAPSGSSWPQSQTPAPGSSSWPPQQARPARRLNPLLLGVGALLLLAVLGGAFTLLGGEDGDETASRSATATAAALASADPDDDGVTGDDDQCPDESGPAETNGCTIDGDDPDGDGVTGDDDQCPDESGPAETNGCTIDGDDPDGDGVTGDDDECEDESGPAENNGCPLDGDSDGDGVPDDDDECEDESGPAENNGCPVDGEDGEDGDGDGVADAEDACAETAGRIETSGCPAEEVDWVHDNGSRILTTPAVADGLAFYGDEAGVFHALDLETQEERWFTDTGRLIHGTPAVGEGVVYFGNHDGKFYALDAATGEKKWMLETGHAIWSQPAVSNDLVYFGNDGAIFYAVKVESGEIAWQQPVDKVAGSPVVVEDVVLIGGNPNLHVFDAATGENHRQFDAGGDVQSTPLYYEDRLYFGSSNGELYIVDVNSGDVVARQNIGKTVGSAVLADGKIYFGSFDGTLYEVDPAYPDAGPAVLTTAGDVIASKPAYQDDVLYFGSDDNNLYAFDLALRKEAWRQEVVDNVNTPVLSDDGMIYVISGNNFYGFTIYR